VFLYAELSSSAEAPTTKYYYAEHNLACIMPKESKVIGTNSKTAYTNLVGNRRITGWQQRELDKLDINDNAIGSQKTVMCNRY